VAEDARQPPHVLVFQVAGGRPLVDADGQYVPPRPQIRPGVELGGQPAAGGEAQLVPVQPDLRVRFDALEADPAAAPALRQVEGAPVVAGRVLGRHVRRVDRERVGDVGVRGSAVAVQRPVRRNLQFVPPRVVVAGAGEVLRDGRYRRQAEPPGAVEVDRGSVRAEGRAGFETAGTGGETFAFHRLPSLDAGPAFVSGVFRGSDARCGGEVARQQALSHLVHGLVAGQEIGAV